MIPGRGEVAGPTLREEAERHTGAPVFVVHRLDREASGVLVFAKDAETHRQLNAAFEHREVGKTYLAVVQGDLEHDRTINRPLKEFGSGRMGVAKRGRPAVTALRVLHRGGSTTLLEASPRTGKRHQIRVHLYSIGHPIMGDPLYGSPLPVGGLKRLMLHATALAFDVPATGPVRVESPPPRSFGPFPPQEPAARDRG